MPGPVLPRHFRSCSCPIKMSVFPQIVGHFLIFFENFLRVHLLDSARALRFRSKQMSCRQNGLSKQQGTSQSTSPTSSDDEEEFSEYVPDCVLEAIDELDAAVERAFAAGPGSVDVARVVHAILTAVRLVDASNGSSQVCFPGLSSKAPTTASSTARTSAPPQ